MNKKRDETTGRFVGSGNQSEPIFLRLNPEITKWLRSQANDHGLSIGQFLALLKEKHEQVFQCPQCKFDESQMPKGVSRPGIRFRTP